jgi:hypothetical protein
MDCRSNQVIFALAQNLSAADWAVERLLAL